MKKYGPYILWIFVLLDRKISYKCMKKWTPFMEKKSAVHGHWTHHSTVWTCALALLATEPATEIVPFFIPLVMHHVRKWKKFKQKYEFSGLCNDELSHQCTVIYGEKYRIFRLLYSLKCVWKYIFMQYWSTILFRISVQHFAGIFPKHYSRDEVLLFLAPVRKIIKIFTTLVWKKYDWICSVCTFLLRAA